MVNQNSLSNPFSEALLALKVSLSKQGRIIKNCWFPLAVIFFGYDLFYNFSIIASNIFGDNVPLLKSQDFGLFISTGMTKETLDNPTARNLVWILKKTYYILLWCWFFVKLAQSYCSENQKQKVNIKPVLKVSIIFLTMTISTMLVLSAISPNSVGLSMKKSGADLYYFELAYALFIPFFHSLFFRASTSTQLKLPAYFHIVKKQYFPVLLASLAIMILYIAGKIFSVGVHKEIVKIAKEGNMPNLLSPFAFWFAHAIKMYITLITISSFTHIFNRYMMAIISSHKK